jgi:hypothetical protein
MTDGHQVQQRPLRAAAESRERPVLPTGALGRTGRLAMLPLRHAARTAAAASRLSRAATDQVAAPYRSALRRLTDAAIRS